jgi:hypothetical protein
MLPFVGALYSKAEFTTLHDLDPRLIQYAMKVKQNVYQDGNVRHGNVAGFINSSTSRNDIANVYWEYYNLPRPWNSKKWGYIMTMAMRDIAAGEELFTYYPMK